VIVVSTATGLAGVSQHVHSGQSFSNWITIGRLDDPAAPVARIAVTAQASAAPSNRILITSPPVR
jgi:hypothetical protein